MPESKWKSHISENFFGKMSNQVSIKDGLEGTLGNRDTAAKKYQNMRINGKGIWRLSINRTICYLARPRTQVRVVNLIWPRISVPSHPRKMITLAAISTAVILIPPYLVTASGTR